MLVNLFGLVSVMVGGVASKVALLTPGMRIPALVTPLASLGAATVLWGDLRSEAFWELSGSDVMTWTASAVALVAWGIPFVMPKVSVVQNPKELLRPFSENFHSFTWRPFFLEQHLMLNTNVGHDYDSSVHGSGGGGGVDLSLQGRRKRVYICTTMYRETETEMRR